MILVPETSIRRCAREGRNKSTSRRGILSSTKKGESTRPTAPERFRFLQVRAALVIANLRLYFLSNSANIGPSDKRLPWRLSDGAYKLGALPPSRNRALGQFSPSRNRRAKASNDTSP